MELLWLNGSLAFMVHVGVFGNQRREPLLAEALPGVHLRKM